MNWIQNIDLESIVYEAQWSVHLWIKHKQKLKYLHFYFKQPILNRIGNSNLNR